MPRRCLVAAWAEWTTDRLPGSGSEGGGGQSGVRPHLPALLHLSCHAPARNPSGAAPARIHSFAHAAFSGSTSFCSTARLATTIPQTRPGRRPSDRAPIPFALAASLVGVPAPAGSPFAAHVLSARLSPGSVGIRSWSDSPVTRRCAPSKLFSFSFAVFQLEPFFTSSVADKPSPDHVALYGSGRLMPSTRKGFPFASLR